MSKAAKDNPKKKVPPSPHNSTKSSDSGLFEENEIGRDNFGTNQELSYDAYRASVRKRFIETLDMPGKKFKSAVLRDKNPDCWYIEYYAYDPTTGKRRRKREKCNTITDTKQRRKEAKARIEEINSLLFAGWSPFLDQLNINGTITFNAAFKEYAKSIPRTREDSERTYTSQLKFFYQWLSNAAMINKPVLNFNIAHAQSFLQWRQKKFKLSNTSINNVHSLIRTFFNFCVKRGYIEKNPFTQIGIQKKEAKFRQPIPEPDLYKIMEYLETTNPQFLLLIRLIFYCGLRPTEISRLQVYNIQLARSIIFINAHQAKDHDDAPITIPHFLVEPLAIHIAGKERNYYLFDKNLSCGKLPSNGRAYAKKWAELRKDLNLPNEYQLYSMKDTGAYFISENITSPIELRDQLRHSDLETTNRYIRKALPEANQNIARMNQVI